MLYIGCPMWGYKEWVGEFFPPHTPQSDFLRLYSRKLTTVEGNTTFYAIPAAETVARWRAETPETFRFCFKIPRSISHTPDLENHRQETFFFIERMRGLGERLGTMFLQLPPAFSPVQTTQLRSFLEFWPADVRLAVEVRHAGFFEAEHAEALNKLLGEYKVARVLMDTRPIRVGPGEEQRVLQARERKPDLPLQVAITTDLTFVRYIGNPNMDVNNPFLETWARQLAQWLKQKVTAYVFCHCPFEIHSPAICFALYERIRALASLHPLPWQPERLDSGPEQGRLF